MHSRGVFAPASGGGFQPMAATLWARAEALLVPLNVFNYGDSGVDFHPLPPQSKLIAYRGCCQLGLGRLGPRLAGAAALGQPLIDEQQDHADGDGVIGEVGNV